MSASVVDGTVVDGTVVHGWCGWVEKSNEVMCKLMVLNKLWIPDVLIDIIKDYLFVSATEVLRKFYRVHLNSSITDLWVNYIPLMDIYGRTRQITYALGYIYGGEDIQLQGHICVTCGDFDHFHDNANGCCALMWDGADGELELMAEEDDLEVTDETVAEINAENEDEDEEIPEVTWGIDIPDASDNELRQTVLDNWSYQSVEDAFQEAMEEMSCAKNLEEVARQRADDALWGRQPDEQYNYDDIEAQWDSGDQADYAEYQREIEMEAYWGRLGL
jgi:hypothetical protein